MQPMIPVNVRTYGVVVSTTIVSALRYLDTFRSGLNIAFGVGVFGNTTATGTNAYDVSLSESARFGIGATELIYASIGFLTFIGAIIYYSCCAKIYTQPAAPAAGAGAGAATFPDYTTVITAALAQNANNPSPQQVYDYLAGQANMKGLLPTALDFINRPTVPSVNQMRTDLNAAVARLRAMYAGTPSNSEILTVARTAGANNAINNADGLRDAVLQIPGLSVTQQSRIRKVASTSYRLCGAQYCAQRDRTKNEALENIEGAFPSEGETLDPSSRLLTRSERANVALRSFVADKGYIRLLSFAASLVGGILLITANGNKVVGGVMVALSVAVTRASTDNTPVTPAPRA